jgi:hypothetical protein
VKVEAQGVVSIKGDKGDFSDYGFKEGNTACVSLKDIFIQEKGKDSLKKVEAGEATSSAPKVRGGAKGKKGAAKAAAKAKGKKSTEAGSVRKSIDKIIKYTPSKSVE